MALSRAPVYDGPRLLPSGPHGVNGAERARPWTVATGPARDRAAGPVGQGPRRRYVGAAKPRARPDALHRATRSDAHKYRGEPPVRSCLKLMSKENLQALVTLGLNSRWTVT